MSGTLRTYSAVSDGTVTLNLGDAFSLLRIPDRKELGGLVEDFRRRQWAWLRDHLMAPAPGDPGYIVGLVGTVQKVKNKAGVPNGKLVYQPHRLAPSKVPPEIWNLLTPGQNADYVNNTARYVGKGIDEQRRFMDAVLGPAYSADVMAYFRPEYHDVFFYSWIDQALHGSETPGHFIRDLIERTVWERRELAPEERTKGFQRRFMPDALLVWLAMNGILLHPVRDKVVPGMQAEILEYLWAEGVKESWNGIVSRHGAEWETRVHRWRVNLRQAFDTVVLTSTLRSPDDLANEMFEDLFACMDARLHTQITDKLAVVHRALRDGLDRPERLPLFKPRRGRKKEHPFAWTQAAYDPAIPGLFPKFFPGPYEPRDHLVRWADRLWDLLEKSHLKSIGNLVNTCQHLLAWMAVHPKTFATVDDITREDINDGRGKTEGLSFRAYMARQDITPETRNSNLMRAAWIFDHLIEQDRLERPNPVNLRFDAFKVTSARGKTPRTALDREMLTYLRQVNARDDFALSRSYRSHYRRLLNPDTGQYEDVWFPGFAVLIDLLLQLPLRSFQGRFLDSGEGDERVVDTGGPQPQLVTNAHPAAAKGRREGVFYTFQAAKGDEALGIYVNTNKTAVDRESGYEIPWSSEDIRRNLRFMVDWQARFNPIAEPIPCMERLDVEQSRNAELLAAAKTCFPLFRDPNEPNGWPMSRDKLYDYWCRLLAAAEDDLTAQGTPVVLTVEKEVSKGRNKNPTTRRAALYDVHTLRVSGITSLIEAGLPPDLVQEVAGHAVLVMTLYYNKMKAAKLNERLSQAMEETGIRLDQIEGLGEDDYERVASFLVNRRAAEDAVGKTMLSERIGHGIGGFEMMSHGICPGGECSTGGEFMNQAVGYGPVPRPLACSLCRYRLTGPMFLPGLVLNANRLMHELRRKAVEIARLNREKADLADAGKSAHSVKAQIEALYRETDVIAAEWAAEVQYVHHAEQLFDAFVGDDAPKEPTATALVTGLEQAALEAKIEERPEFVLLQNLAEGAQVWPGFRPKAAIDDHREFLNEILAANDVQPFLLSLKDSHRDRAAVLLGRTILAAVPEERIDELREGTSRLSDYPSVGGFLDTIRTENTGGSIPVLEPAELENA